MAKASARAPAGSSRRARAGCCSSYGYLSFCLWAGPILTTAVFASLCILCTDLYVAFQTERLFAERVSLAENGWNFARVLDPDSAEAYSIKGFFWAYPYGGRRIQEEDAALQAPVVAHWSSGVEYSNWKANPGLPPFTLTCLRGELLAQDGDLPQLLRSRAARAWGAVAARASGNGTACYVREVYTQRLDMGFVVATSVIMLALAAFFGGLLLLVPGLMCCLTRRRLNRLRAAQGRPAGGRRRGPQGVLRGAAEEAEREAMREGVRVEGPASGKGRGGGKERKHREDLKGRKDRTDYGPLASDFAKPRDSNSCGPLQLVLDSTAGGDLDAEAEADAPPGRWGGDVLGSEEGR